MVKKTVNIINKMGLHARPSTQIVKTANKFQSDFKIIKDGIEYDGKSVINLMMLAAEFNSQLDLIADGSDAHELIREVSQLFENKFGED